MNTKRLLGAITLLMLLGSLVPTGRAVAAAPIVVPPVNMFQLPWEQGTSWVAYDGLDNGFKRLLNSPHNYLNGGAVDFAPHKNMKLGEDTSNAWVTAAADGIVIQISVCGLKIDHGNGWITDYQFLAHIQVKLGDTVYRNQRLAVIADGLGEKFCPPALEPDTPHVHFSLRPNMRNASFSGWVINYVPLLNKTTFTRNGESLGSFQPILNSLELQIVVREAITWDTDYSGSVDSARYERWPFILDETTNFTLTATPTMSGLVPVLVLLDASGNEIMHASSPLTSTQPAGNYFVQVQPQTGSGSYHLRLQKNSLPEPSGPYSSTLITPANVGVGASANVTVTLGNLPAEGYSSAEFTCTYDPSVADASNITAAGLFGTDAVVAMNGPQNGSFILAIAGSSGNKATSTGTTFTFGLKGLQAGQTAVECKARVSKGDNTLTEIQSSAANLTVGSATPTPTAPVTPMPPVATSATPTSPSISTPTPTATGTGTIGWNTYENGKYGFSFKFPPGSSIESQSDNSGRINLPFATGTLLSGKWIDVTVVEGADPCKSPNAGLVSSSENITINNLQFLKELGIEGTAGHFYDITSYSTRNNNACISLTFVLKSVDPGAFATPPPPYDKAAESAVFPIIMSTFGLSSTPATPTPTPTSASSTLLTGKVLASKPITVLLYHTDASLAGSVVANGDVSFTLTAAAGSYTVVARASGFLSAQGSVILTDGQTSTLPTIGLLAGDIDGNNVIDQFDALTIGMSYNGTAPAAADLNNDGIINVLDLELLAKNYRASGALAWE